MIAYVINAVLLAGFVITLGFVGWGIEPSDLRWWLLAGPLVGWVGFPYAVVALTTRRVAQAWLALWLLLGVSLAVVASTVAILYDAFVAEVDARSGLVFLILPVYQVLIWGPCALVAYWLKAHADRRKPAGLDVPTSKCADSGRVRANDTPSQ